MLVVETTPRFDNELIEILDFIAEDSSHRALDFYDELIEKLHDIPSNPYMYRKREHMDENIRELIYKGIMHRYGKRCCFYLRYLQSKFVGFHSNLRRYFFKGLCYNW